MKNSIARKLTQVPEGYLLVGMDPHKKQHAAVIISQDAVVHRKFKLTNSREGYEEMLKLVATEVSKTGARGAIYSIEAGSHYWRNLVYYLDAQGIPFRLVSPFTLKRTREGDDINRRKNDYRDAEMAAELLRNGKFINTRLPYGAYAEIRATYNNYQRLVKENTSQINLLKSLLDGIFPEFCEIFKDLRGKTALSVLTTCVIPAQILKWDFSVFMDLIKSNFVGRAPKTQKLRELYLLAQKSIGIKEGSEGVETEIRLLAERIKLNSEQNEILIKKLRKLVDSLPESKYMLSIRGLGYLTVAGLLAGFGCLSDFNNSRQLIKMAGTNPTERESGGKSSKNTPMSKQGKASLRRSLWPAIVSLLRYNQDFKDWAKARQERPVQSHPLHRREVIGAAINRLLRLVFALVKKHEYYQERLGALTIFAE